MTAQQLREKAEAVKAARTAYDDSSGPSPAKWRAYCLAKNAYEELACKHENIIALLDQLEAAQKDAKALRDALGPLCIWLD